MATRKYATKLIFLILKIAYRFHLCRCELSVNRSILIAFLHLYKFVTIQSADTLHFSAVHGLFIELLAEFEFYFSVFEGTSRLQGIHSIFFRQLDDGADSGAHFSRHHTHAWNKVKTI